MVLNSKYGDKLAVLMANCATIDAFVVAVVLNKIVACDVDRLGVVDKRAFVVFGGFGGVDVVPPLGV
jgi:hypothetical protein